MKKQNPKALPFKLSVRFSLAATLAARGITALAAGGDRQAEHRLHPRRRPRLRRRRLLRRDEGQDAERRPAGRGRACASPTRIAAATCTPSRYALLTGEYALPQEGHRHAARRRAAHHRARPHDGALDAEAGRLRDRLRRQVAPRPGQRQPRLERRDQARARSKSASTTPSSSPPPATACRACSSRTTASSGLDPTDPIQVSYGKPVGDEPTGQDHPELLKMQPSHGHDKTIVNGISRIGYMSGGKAARWVDEDMADTLTAQGRRRSSSRTRTGRSSSTSRRTTSTCRACRTRASSARASAACAATSSASSTGRVGRGAGHARPPEARRQHARDLHQRQRPRGRRRLRRTAPSRNSTATSRPARCAAASTASSKAARACRSSCAGPGRVKPGVSDALVCQVDLLATLRRLDRAEAAGRRRPGQLQRAARAAGRSPEEGPRASGGARQRRGAAQGRVETHPRRPEAGVEERPNRATRNRAPPAPNGAQLYNLATDIAEEKNLAAERPEVVEELSALLQKVTQGEPRMNASETIFDLRFVIWNGHQIEN